MTFMQIIFKKLVSNNMSKVKNPTVDSRVIKASFRACPIDDRKLFSISNCLALISMDSLSHEGEKFRATVDLINRSFKSCTILVGDTLYRHNLMKELPTSSKADVYLKSLELGDCWIKRNQAIVERLTIPYEITRWSKWLEHPDFENRLLQIEALYEKDNIFKNNFDLAVDEYLGRGLKSSGHEGDFAACLSYLKEECAIMTLWVTNHYDFELYPSGRNMAMAITYEYLIKPRFPHLLKPVALRFKKSG